MGKTRAELPLHKKVEVIRELDKGRSQRDLARIYQVSKGQIQRCGENKDALLEEWESFSTAQNRRRRNKVQHEDLDAKVMEWFRETTSKRIPVSGPMIQERARMIAAEAGILGFSASNGWLESFRRRHNILFRTLCGEAGDVDEEVVADWKQRLPGLIEGYQAKDIFNMDETGLFFRALPNKTLVEKGKQCRGGKMAKERLSLAFCCSAVGEKFKPLVIWKSLNPRCFQGQNVKGLGVYWEANRKAWMTTVIFEQWLRKFNSKMQQQNRKVLLLLDNASCHGHRAMTNVRLLFLPPNATSHLQPLDQGIIQSFKIHYRNFMLRWLLTRSNECNTAAEMTKKINVLEAIRWIRRAWDLVEESTIIKCFRRSGIESDDVRELENEDLRIQDEVSQLAETAGIHDPCFEEELDCFGNSEEGDPSSESQDVIQIRDDESVEDEETIANLRLEPPSAEQALVAVGSLKIFAVTSSVLPKDAYDSILKIEKQIEDSIISNKRISMRQSTLDSFFRE